MKADTSSILSLEEEKDLVARLKQGDSRALEPIWKAYAPVVYRSVIYPALPIEDLAQEVLQQTFLKVFERIGGYQPQTRGILPWIKTMARNLAIDVHRKNKRTDRLCKGYGQHRDIVDAQPQQLARPDQALIAKQEKDLTRTRVRAVLDSGKLNERYARAIELRLFQDLDRQECADTLGVRTGTFDVLFHRALKRFEAIYREMFEGGNSP